MKKYLLLTVISIIVSQLAQAQQLSGTGLFSGIRINQNRDLTFSSIYYHDTTYSGEYYLQKSKNQKTAAWVMLGGGIALSVVGIVGFSANYDVFVENGAAESYAFVTLVGAGLSLGSIPLFIASKRNHNKAATLSFKSQHIYIPQQNSFVFKSQPAVSLVIPL